MSVYSVSVHPSSVTLIVGNWYYDAYAVVNASSCCGTGVTWYSSNTNVATVNASSGYIYARSAGTARIYARSTADSSKSDYVTVTVTSGTVCVNSISLNKSNVTLERDDSVTLTATVSPANATNKTISWRSTNTSVATVCEGVVTAKAIGNTYIYAEAEDGSGKYARCYVHVTGDILVKSISVSPSSKTMNVGDSFTLNETVCPSNATNKCVTWSSSNTNVVSVNQDSGFIYAKKGGSAKIYATATDGSGAQGYCNVTVNSPIHVESVTVCPQCKTMNVGETTYLDITVCPVNATNKSITWCSSDENVAEVGIHSGRIFAKRAGTTTITATTVDGGFTDCASITTFEAYANELENSFGFSSNETRLIRMLYDKVYTKFTSESVISQAWKCARLLSEFSYDYYSTIVGIRLNRWDDVAGSVTTEKNRRTYFVDTLGYTDQEYIIIRDGLLRNHNEANNNRQIIDFTHMQYSLAARLAYTLNKDESWSNFGAGLYTGNYGIYTDEEISYLAGWLGDAVLTNIYGVGTTSFGSDDYMSDLDAENIYRIIIQGNTSIDAINTYYSQLSASNTRADIFLQHLPFNTVKGKIFYELIDAQLYSFMSNASNQGDIVMTQYYLNLINDEQYHWDTIKSNYPDTYDFLKSLNDCRATMIHYQ